MALSSEELSRYREMDLWTGLIERSRSLHVSLPGRPCRFNTALADDAMTTLLDRWEAAIKAGDAAVGVFQDQAYLTAQFADEQ